MNLVECTTRAIQKVSIRKYVISWTKVTQSVKLSLNLSSDLWEKTKRALIIWIEELIQRRISISSYVIKLLLFYEHIKQLKPSTSTFQAEKKFSASKEWLTVFLKNASNKISTEVRKLLKTELSWKKISGRTYIAKFEEDASGFKVKTY